MRLSRPGSVLWMLSHDMSWRDPATLNPKPSCTNDSNRPAEIPAQGDASDVALQTCRGLGFRGLGFRV